MKQTILFLCALAMLFTISNIYKEDYYIIPDESIRIRIIPNSNNLKDQLLKNIIKTNIELEIENDLKNAKTIDDSRIIIKNNINNYKTIVQEVLKNEKIKQNYQIDYGYHYFPTKKYKGVIYKSGNYESLLITIGQGKGDNWWCILFPPLCPLETENNDITNVEYTSYIKELFNKYIKK